MRKIIDEAAAGRGRRRSDEARKVGDLYKSFMDEARLETLGLKPLDATFAAIDRVKDKSELPALIASLQQIGITTPFDLDIDQDKRNSTAYVVYLSQSGLGLPDRDYYLTDDDAKLVEVRRKYGEHIEKMLAMAGSKTAKQDAADILALETKIARAHWTKVESRDPVKTYAKVATKDLPATAPGFDWQAYLEAAGVAPKVNDVVLYQASYLKDFGTLFAETPLSVWKTYFKWAALRDYARFLDKQYVDERFAFYGTTLTGIPQNRPRWQRGVAVVNESIGEALGRVYVAKYFPPESKARMEKLVANLLLAYKQSIDKLDWMGPETKKEAQAKLAKITPKIGYPAKWRDYSKLVIAPDDLVGNVMRARRFEYDRNVAKLGKPVDRDEWYMTPQTVNAYYNPLMNEIVFPAAYLQPPYFNAARGRRRELRRRRRDDRPRDQPRLRRFRQPVRRRRQPARLVDARGPQALRREDESAGRAVRRVQPGAGLQRQRQADARREHRRPVGPRDRVQGVPAVARRQGSAGDRRDDGRRAILPELRAGLARQDARRAADRLSQVRPALARPVPRERPAVEPRRVLPDVQAQGRRQDVPAAEGAGVDLVGQLKSRVRPCFSAVRRGEARRRQK